MTKEESNDPDESTLLGTTVVYEEAGVRLVVTLVILQRPNDFLFSLSHWTLLLKEP